MLRSFAVLMFALVWTLTLCTACTTNYTRNEALVDAQLGTKRNKPSGKPVIENTGRVLAHIHGNRSAEYDVLSGSQSRLDTHAPPPRIPGAPAVPPTNGGPPPDVPLNSVPTTVVNDTTEGESNLIAAFPFFELLNGFAYITGFAPAAQTKHVIAGSDSTTFMIEIDKSGGTPDTEIHRVYAIDAPSNVGVQARDDNGNPIGPIILVPTGRYVEIRKDGGDWAIYGPSVYPVANNGTLEAVRTAATAANLP